MWWLCPPCGGGKWGCDDPRLRKARRGVVLVVRRFDHVTLLALFVLLPLLVLLGMSVRVWSSVRSGRAMPPALALRRSSAVSRFLIVRAAVLPPLVGIVVLGLVADASSFPDICRFSGRSAQDQEGPSNTGLSAAREDMLRKPLGVPAATRDDRASGDGAPASVAWPAA